MFDAAALPEEHVLIIGNVTGGVDVGLVGPEVFVHRYAITEFDSAVHEHVRRGDHADTHNDHLAGDCLAICEHYGMHCPIAPQFRYGGTLNKAHAASGIIRL